MIDLCVTVTHTHTHTHTHTRTIMITDTPTSTCTHTHRPPCSHLHAWSHAYTHHYHAKYCSLQCEYHINLHGNRYFVYFIHHELFFTKCGLNICLINEERNQFCSYAFLFSMRVLERLGQKPFFWLGLKTLEYHRLFILVSLSGSQI